MAELTYSTSFSLDGPWLLDSRALFELDEVIEDQWVRLTSGRAELIEEKVERSLGNLARFDLSKEKLDEKRKSLREQYTKSELDREKKEVRLNLSEGRVLMTSSFAEASKNPAVASECPTGFKVAVHLGQRMVSIEVGGTLNDLRISAFPEQDQQTRELFVALRQWALSYRSPRWQQLWAAWAGFHWFIWLLMLGLVGGIADIGSNPYKAEAKDRARVLLERSLSTDKIPEALELLLILDTGYSPHKPQQSSIPGWFKALFFGGLLASTILSIRPKVVIGIGNGSSRITAWRRWLRIVSVTLPTLLFGSFVWPKVVSIIWQLVGSP